MEWRRYQRYLLRSTYVGTCLGYSLLADSLPRWYLPEESGQGGDAVGEGGGQGGAKEATPVPASQPASKPA